MSEILAPDSESVDSFKKPYRLIYSFTKSHDLFLMADRDGDQTVLLDIFLKITFRL